MRWLFVLFLIGIASLTRAEMVVPTQNLRAGTILTFADLRLANQTHPGVVSSIDDAVGKEARVVLYAGRPIRKEDIIEPAVINRNQIVPLIFEQSGLRISTGGRALDRGGVGDIIRVMNITSRKTMFGRVLSDGTVDVSNP